MAEASDSSGQLNHIRWYCHTCETEVQPTSDYACSRCQDGFIEQVEDPAPEAHTHEVESGINIASQVSESSTDTRPSRQQAYRPRHTATHISIHHLPAAPGVNPFNEFISQVIGSIMGGVMQQGPLNIQIAPWQVGGRNVGDYVLTQGGLDNVITMLLNQLDGAGPPPAQSDQIEALPTIIIVQEQVDSCLQCHICMEEFQLDEKVRGLPCKHVYHGECIIPWLQLHGTCPVCRKSVDNQHGDVTRSPTDVLPD